MAQLLFVYGDLLGIFDTMGFITMNHSHFGKTFSQPAVSSKSKLRKNHLGTWQISKTTLPKLNQRASERLPLKVPMVGLEDDPPSC